jgi:hypothetical protein
LPFSTFSPRDRLRWLCVCNSLNDRKENTTAMIKKAVLALMLALALSSSVSVATAHVDLPDCLPCDTK